MTDWNAKRNEFLALARDAEIADNFAIGSWLRLFGKNCELMASDDSVRRERGSQLIAQNFSRFVRDILCPEIGRRMRGEIA